MLNKKILLPYCGHIKKEGTFYLSEKSIPSEILNNKKSLVFGLNNAKFVGFLDTSKRHDGCKGYLFESDQLVIQTTGNKRILLFKEIEKVFLVGSDENAYLKIELDNNRNFFLYDSSINKASFRNLLIRILEKSPGDTAYRLRSSGKSNYDPVITGTASARRDQVNILFEEEKIHARQGHGFAAERANTLYDRVTGKKAEIVGDDNALNGADRLVDGVLIQSKYCATGKRCIDECFDGNTFRYLHDGKPMVIEVPSDKYSDAVKAMESRIKAGQIPGVSDPQNAKDIVKKGHFTYNQALNLAKAGTIESLTYDAVNGTVLSLKAGSITFFISFAVSLWRGEKTENALKIATASALKANGTVFITHILGSQLSKAGLNSLLVGSSEAVVKLMGPKASAVIINLFRGSEKAIYGAAAMKSCSKLLRGNLITGTITVVVLSSADIVRIFRGRISLAQLLKNAGVTTVGVAAGTGGYLVGKAGGTAAGAKIGAAIGTFFAPGIGTTAGAAIGGIVGGLVVGAGAGTLASKGSKKVLDHFIEDDAEKMIRIIEDRFKELSQDYLLNKKEAEAIAQRLQQQLKAKTLRDMFASESRKRFADDMLIPIIKAELKLSRKKVSLPSSGQTIQALKAVLEDIDNNKDVS